MRTRNTEAIKHAPWVAKFGLFAPYGLCQCGCGQVAPISTATKAQKGYLVRHPVRFVPGHQNGAKQTLKDAFWQHLTVGDPNKCWEWQGHITSKGYGVLRHRATSPLQIRAHRVSYEFHHGPIPEGMNVLHKCDNRRCCNPHHLFLGTQPDNVADMVAKGRHSNGARGKATINH